jgi:hypothetical protein
VTTTGKCTIKGSRKLKPKTIPLLEQCIETGIQLGWNRAHKHTAAPAYSQIEHEILNAIMNEIHEWFDFDELKNLH